MDRIRNYNEGLFINLTREQKELIEKLARKRGVSQAGLIRSALYEFVKREGELVKS